MAPNYRNDGSVFPERWLSKSGQVALSEPESSVMSYLGTNYDMCIISRQIDRIRFINTDTGLVTEIFNPISYTTESDAINGYCREAVGYGATAYNVKFITGTNPNLSLPVSGPVY